MVSGLRPRMEHPYVSVVFDSLWQVLWIQRALRLWIQRALNGLHKGPGNISPDPRSLVAFNQEGRFHERILFFRMLGLLSQTS